MGFSVTGDYPVSHDVHPTVVPATKLKDPPPVVQALSPGAQGSHPSLKLLSSGGELLLESWPRIDEIAVHRIPSGYSWR
jgi:hypothetical protein